MQNYIDFAQKNNIVLLKEGKCQFCGAPTTKGVDECINIFNFDVQGIDFSSPENLIYKFFIVDAHTLQHSEIHGRWNNHFHLARLHLIFKYNVIWNYKLSPLLSNCLKIYKINNPDKYLTPPETLERGNITVIDIKNYIGTQDGCRALIKKWAQEVYNVWSYHHNTIDTIAKNFLNHK